MQVTFLPTLWYSILQVYTVAVCIFGINRKLECHPTESAARGDRPLPPPCVRYCRTLSLMGKPLVKGRNPLTAFPLLPITIPRNGTDVAGRRTPPARGSRDQNPPTIGADHITAGPPYTAVHCRRSSFPVAAARTWNDLPRHVTSASSLPVSRSRLKTHFFRRSFASLLLSACEVTTL